MQRFARLSSLCLIAVIGCGGGGNDTMGPGGNQTQTLASVRLSPSSFNLTAGQITTLNPQALDASGAVIASASGYAYSSSAPTVAEVRPDGTLLALGAGSATITVSLTRDGVTASGTASVSVTGTLPTSVTITAGTDNQFNPKTVIVARNASVDYEFLSVVHNVTYGSATGAPSNIPNSSNTSVSRTFGADGDFSYECTIHSGMTGTVIVR